MIPVPLSAILGVVLTLLLSIGGNVWLSGRVDSLKAERALAAEQGKAQALQEAADRSAQIAVDAVADQTALLTDLQAIADRAQQTRTVYRERIRELPAASCAPGADRVAAANALIAGERQ